MEPTTCPVRVEAMVGGRWVPATARPLGFGGRGGSAAVEVLATGEAYHASPGRWRVVPGPTLASGVWDDRE